MEDDRLNLTLTLKKLVDPNQILIKQRIGHGFRLWKQDDYFRVPFDHFEASAIFWGSWAVI